MPIEHSIRRVAVLLELSYFAGCAAGPGDARLTRANNLRLN
jgi:hypothetical protein